MKFWFLSVLGYRFRVIYPDKQRSVPMDLTDAKSYRNIFGGTVEVVWDDTVYQ